MDIGGRYDRRVTPPLISAIRDWFLRSLERHPGVSPQPRPAAERGGGLLKREDVLVEFRLWAPGKRSVAVAGTWNGWAKDRDRLSPAHFKRAKSSELMLGDPSYHRELLAQRIGI